MTDKSAKAKEIIASYGQLQDELQGIVAAVHALIDKIALLHTDAVIELESESAFYDLVAAIGDELYSGGMFTEPVDGYAFRKVLDLVDKPVLDRVLGEDWFVQLQERAMNLKAGVTDGSEAES